ncbi:glycosyltransferase family 4 protein [Antarcticibacterium flavum]|uniref:Glycosyltransferase family 4 protein n=1 Tax=Antarcticibacterium flavum TaxID=2058175 RepID=A0A5B7WY09_9FLAO|nr:MULTISPECIES: glycosyltransferase family 4 protein [Antarcticibacterium]MCM4160821.1 glycosyl transferase group 1 [Antarcticibacterium sp. W02-3]QCY67989.1 glycosyltransferase family 4 protein [Antarcticibacterium flavum]
MKILILSHYFFPSIGGIEVTSELFADHFAKKGHLVKVLTWSKDPTAKVFGYEVIRDPGPKKVIKAYLWADIIFENNPCLRLAWPGLFIRKPFVISIHTWISRSDGNLGIQDRLKIWRLKRSSKTIAASNALKRKTGLDSIVIPNPYRKDLFKILPQTQRVKQYIFLGRLVSDKGAEMAIMAIAHLKELLLTIKPDIRINLTIVGEGPQRTSLEKLVKELQLEREVEFTGTLLGEKLVFSLNQHRFILIPSVWEEPFGLIALEGMACGCIPIASNGGGLPEAVGPGGVLFQRGDMGDLVNHMQKLLQDPLQEAKCRNAAPAHLAAHHSSFIAERYLDVLTKAVNA